MSMPLHGVFKVIDSEPKCTRSNEVQNVLCFRASNVFPVVTALLTIAPKLLCVAGALFFTVTVYLSKSRIGRRVISSGCSGPYL
ncbi:hypothetical protein BDR05DRAFT_63625 [Suillus weaverae]|nr:hypothetical protein BDR05DRAFT_63625 [Suillus weaverae]